MDNTLQNQNNYEQYSPKWQERFRFFDSNGAPKTKESKAAFKSLPFMKRVLIMTNFWAFFFGFIFFFVTGMWKKGLVLLGISIGLGIAFFIMGMLLPVGLVDALSRGLGLAYSLVVGMSANYAYYLKSVKNDDGWNPFDGLGL